MEYEVVIGLEVHAELATKSKIFCSCSTEFGGLPNTHCCPGCIGMPGTLPVLNKSVVEYAIKAGLATNCKISRFTKMDRKNYFYPDLPRAYQISQYDIPICNDGFIEIETGGGKKKIRIARIHIEEDAGKLMHDQWSAGSLVDYNRSGMPLIEIVTYPDLRTAEEVKLFLEELKAILEYTGVSDCKMQEGSLRADINISAKPLDQKNLGIRTEMKNLNSFKAIVRAIEYESKRQINELMSGGTVLRETRRWDDEKGISYSMRSKEEALDYRYYPESDIPPIIIESEWIEQIKTTLPELPNARKIRYIEEYGLPFYDANVITSSKELSDFFEDVVKNGADAKIVSNWIMGELLRFLKDKGDEDIHIPFSAAHLAKLINMIESGTISSTIAKKVFEIMFTSSKDPAVIIEEQGLALIDDIGTLTAVVKKVIENNLNSVNDYKSGNKKALGFLMGQAMKETKGKADPKLLNNIFKEELEK